MTDEPLDLTPLDPDRDDGAADRFVAGVMNRIAARPDPHPVRIGPLWGAASFATPIALAATVILTIAAVALSRRNGPAAPETVAESIGVPGEFRGSLAANATVSGRERR